MWSTKWRLFYFGLNLLSASYDAMMEMCCSMEKIQRYLHGVRGYMNGTYLYLSSIGHAKLSLLL